MRSFLTCNAPVQYKKRAKVGCWQFLEGLDRLEGRDKLEGLDKLEGVEGRGKVEGVETFYYLCGHDGTREGF